MLIRTIPATIGALLLSVPAATQDTSPSRSSDARTAQQQRQGESQTGRVLFASKLLDCQVVDSSGSSIGEVDDVLVNRQGDVGGLVCSFDFLDGQMAIVPLSAASVSASGEDDEIRLQIEKSKAEQMPTFESDDWASAMSDWMISRVRDLGGEPRIQGTSDRTSRWMRVSDLMDADIVSQQGDQDLGEVEDLLIVRNPSKVRAVVIGTGGFLGIGEERHAIEWSQIDRESSSTLAASISEEELEDYPSFTRDSEYLDPGRDERTDTNQPRTGSESGFREASGTRRNATASGREQMDDESLWIVEVTEFYAVPASAFREPRIQLDSVPADLQFRLQRGDRFEFLVEAFETESGEWDSRATDMKSHESASKSQEKQSGQTQQASKSKISDSPYVAEYALEVLDVRNGSALVEVDVCWCKGWDECGAMQTKSSKQAGLDKDHKANNTRTMRVQVDQDGRIQRIGLRRDDSDHFTPARKKLVEKHLAAIFGSGLHGERLRPGDTRSPEIGVGSRRGGMDVVARYTGTHSLDNVEVAHFAVMSDPSGASADRRRGNQREDRTRRDGRGRGQDDWQPIRDDTVYGVDRQRGERGADSGGYDEPIRDDTVYGIDRQRDEREADGGGYDEPIRDDSVYGVDRDQERGRGFDQGWQDFDEASNRSGQQQRQQRQSARNGRLRASAGAQPAGIADYRIDDGLLERLVVHPASLHPAGAPSSSLMFAIVRLDGSSSKSTSEGSEKDSELWKDDEESKKPQKSGEQNGQSSQNQR